MAIEQHRHRSGRTVILLRGSFDATEAHRLHDLLSSLDPATRVSVDFHEVRLFDDFTVATLARDLAAAHGSNIELVGLSDHHRRLLQYMGCRPPLR